MRTLFILAIVMTLVGGIFGQAATSKIVIYRLRGTNFGLIHYSQGETPTVSCDGIKVARIGENKEAVISVAPGEYTCTATEQQPGALDASSKSLTLNIAPNKTAYLRLQVHFAHLHFLLQEVPVEKGEAEAQKLLPVKDKNLYARTLPPNKQPATVSSRPR